MSDVIEHGAQVVPCRDQWSWFGSSYRECGLPIGHTGPHEQGGIRWDR